MAHMFLVSCCSCLCSFHWSQVLSWECRCSWSSTDRWWCSNYIWVINNFIAYEGATYIRGLTVCIFQILFIQCSDSCETASSWKLQDSYDDTSASVQVMAWCYQVSSHYLIHCWVCWPRSMVPYGVTRPPWFKLSGFPLAIRTIAKRELAWTFAKIEWLIFAGLANVRCPCNNIRILEC